MFDAGLTEDGEVLVKMSFSATGTTDLPDAKPTGHIAMTGSTFQKFVAAVAEVQEGIQKHQDGKQAS